MRPEELIKYFAKGIKREPIAAGLTIGIWGWAGFWFAVIVVTR